MCVRSRTRRRFPSVLLRTSIILAAVAVWSPSMAVDDPYRTEDMVAPSHSVPAIVGPVVEVPTPLLDQVPDIRDELTLAQLTDLALKNNPRTRQAWAAARFEAAQY